MSARRRISAGDTAFWKFFVPGIDSIMIVFLVVLIGRVLGVHDRWERISKGMIGLQIAGSAALIWMSISSFVRSARLKRVALNDTALHVSNYLREIVVPLSDLEAVDQADGPYSRVVVTFARDTAFGRKVIFAPVERSLPRPHPIIAELRAAVAAGKRG